MARTPRGEIFEEDTVGCYHCVDRCVRRAFLCGSDPVSGKDFDHRKQWLRNRLEQLAAIFGMDVLDFAVLSNHFHRIRSQSRSRSSKPKGRRKRWRRAPARTRPDGWLSPVPLQARLPAGKPRRRASNKGFLSMTLYEYLRLLDWTGRQVRRDKRGSIPADMAPILNRMQISADSWLDMICNFGCWFGAAAGRAESLAIEAARRGRRSLKGISLSRTAFA
jgi:hypothetical protein